MAQTSYDAVVLVDTPWAYYKLDDLSGLPQDSSGNGRHTSSIDGTENYRQAGPFVGAYAIKGNDNSQLNRSSPPNATASVAVEMWIKLGETPGSNDRQFFNIGNVSSGFRIYYNTDGKFYVKVGSAGPTTTTLATSQAALSTSAWTHLVITRESGTWKYYVNGVIDTANAGTQEPGDPSGQALQFNQQLGASADYSQYVSNGAYYTAALSATQVAAHYAAAQVAGIEKRFSFPGATAFPWTTEGGSWDGNLNGVNAGDPATIAPSTGDNSTNDPNATAGEVEVHVGPAGQNVGGEGYPYFEWTGTYEDLGVPLGASIRSIRLDYDWKPRKITGSFDSVNNASRMGPAELRDSGGSLTGTFSTATTVTGGSAEAWGLKSGTPLLRAGADSSSTQIKLRIGAKAVTSTTIGTNEIALRLDRVMVLIEYLPRIVPGEETDSAPVLSYTKKYAITPATETESARTLRAPKLTAASETDSARVLTFSTRFYIPSTGAPPISPAPSSAWEFTPAAFVRRPMPTSKSGSAMATLSVSSAQPIPGNQDTLMIQLISAQLAAQTISGNVKGQILALEHFAGSNYHSQMTIRVIAQDGTVRGTLLAADTNTSVDAHEWPDRSDDDMSFARNRQFPRAGPTVLTTVTSQDGDVLVVEIGYRGLNSFDVSGAGHLRVGDPLVSTDLPEDETDSSISKTPWIEFDSDIVFSTHEAFVAATETDEAQTLSHRRFRTLTPGTEMDSARPLIARKNITAATETDSARPLTSNHHSITEATETDVAVALSVHPEATGTGPGNGGEFFCVQLAPNGTIETATLSLFLSATASQLSLTSDGAFPDFPFVVTIDDEVLRLDPRGAGLYRITHRAMSNTLAAAHLSGATVSWDDTYVMAILSMAEIAADFIAGTEDALPGWVMTFDSSQAYLGTDRYPMHVAEMLGVFPEGGGANRLDGPQPVAICVPPSISDDCPSALGVPGRILTDIIETDVGLLRYTNPEAAELMLCSRAAAMQSWYGFIRVSDTNVDDTFNPTPGSPFGTGGSHSVDVLPLDATEEIHGAQEAFHDQSFITTTLAGTDRYFTFGTPYGDTGWPIAALAVRHGERRVPFWSSPDWHDFGYVYSAFGIDATYVQVLVNRNGLIFGPEAQVQFPGPQDIDGPNATWDVSNYYSSVALDVVLFATPEGYIFIGPGLGGGTIGDPGTASPPIGIVGPGGIPGDIPDEVSLEGGSGGDIDVPQPTGGPVFNHKFKAEA